MRRTGYGSALIVLQVLLGCKTEQSVNPDECLSGTCDETASCAYGVCDGEQAAAPPWSSSEPDDEDMAPGEFAACPFSRDQIPPFESLVDDSNIPEFNRARARSSNFLS